jgi:hypothetical protein
MDDNPAFIAVNTQSTLFIDGATKKKTLSLTRRSNSLETQTLMARVLRQESED